MNAAGLTHAHPLRACALWRCCGVKEQRRGGMQAITQTNGEAAHDSTAKKENNTAEITSSVHGNLKATHSLVRSHSFRASITIWKARSKRTCESALVHWCSEDGIALALAAAALPQRRGSMRISIISDRWIGVLDMAAHTQGIVRRAMKQDASSPPRRSLKSTTAAWER